MDLNIIILKELYRGLRVKDAFYVHGILFLIFCAIFLALFISWLAFSSFLP
jgi:hypothetical protein